MNEEIDRELFIKWKEISFSSEEEYLLWKKNKEEEEKDWERFRKVLKVIWIVGWFALLVRGISSSRGVEINPIWMVIFFIIVLVFAIFSQY
jgi:hypothetical protein